MYVEWNTVYCYHLHLVVIRGNNGNTAIYDIVLHFVIICNIVPAVGQSKY